MHKQSTVFRAFYLQGIAIFVSTNGTSWGSAVATAVLPDAAAQVELYMSSFK